MQINGIDIPEWMARNNSEEQIRKFMNAKPAPVGEFGLITITPVGPVVIGIDLPENIVDDVIDNILEQAPDSELLKFVSKPIDF